LCRWGSLIERLSADTYVGVRHGRFQVAGLAPGDYYAAGWEGEPLDSGLIAAPELLARFAGDAASVTVAEGARLTVNAPRIAAAAIATAAGRMR
jgi:hypothetical protein